MDVPAWAFSNLCIGRTYDSKNNRAGIDIFQPEIKTKTEHVNRFSFQYKSIESKEDVRDLLNISGDISLKIKANIFKVEGAGKYINNNKKDEGVSEILAVMKCTTVNKTMDGSTSVKEEMKGCPSLGTHYVRSVTYGAEMVASLKFKSSSSSKRLNLKGKSDGGLDIQGVATAGLEAQLNKLTSDCEKASDLSIEYYATDLPDKNPTNVKDLVKLIQEFPSRLKKINDGLGVPIKIELQPIESVYPEMNNVSTVQVMECDIDDIESRFDDLYEAQRHVSEYKLKEGVLNSEMKKFNSVVIKTLRTFRSAISSLDKEKVAECLEAYEQALDGEDYDEKFATYWREMIAKKEETHKTDGKSLRSDIKLPSGKDLTIVLLGKTGNGKSATGNRIVGKNHFASSAKGSSVTQHCSFGHRSLERNIFVIDTPGVLDTSSVKSLKTVNLTSQSRYVEKQILLELNKIFALAPKGFDAIMLVARYGTRFTKEDGQALKLLTTFLGKESKEYMILILTWGDQAKVHAEEENITPEECISQWIETLPEWVQEFVNDIKRRVVLFDNRLKEEENPDAFKQQLSHLIKTIDNMSPGKGPFNNDLTKASKEVFDEHVRNALDSSGFTIEFDKLQQEKEQLVSLLKHGTLSEKEKIEYTNLLKDVDEKIDAKLKEREAIKDEKRKEQAEEEIKEASGGAATKNVKENGGSMCCIL